VITEWKVQGGASVSPDDRVRLRIFRPGAPSGGYVLVAQSRLETPQAGQITAFPARMPVRGGESLGVQVAASGNTAAVFGSGPGDMVGTWLTDPVLGADTGSPLQTDSRRVNVLVRLESDNDHDGYGDDTQDSDRDNDGIPDQREVDMGTDPLRADTDGDGAPDGRDICPLARDPRQLDSDLDGRGDGCEPDDDNDGISDDAEAFLHTSPVDRDTDDDGLSDGTEDRLGTNPRRADTDGDGLSDGVERGLRRGVPDPPGEALGTDPRRFRRDFDTRTRTDPLRRDTDRDRLADGREDRNRNGRRDRGETDPRRADSDGDAVPDGADRFPLDRRR
jgi:hypothetical protein